MTRRPALAAALAACLAVALAARPAAAEAPPRTEVESFVRAWRAAWEEQDLQRFMAFHSEDFHSGARDRAAFLAHKRDLFARQETVTVDLGDLEFSEVEEEREHLVRVTFLQDYRSAALSDFGRKELLLRTTDTGMIVVRETWRAATGSIVRPLPRRPDEAQASTPGPAVPSGFEPRLGGGYVPPTAGSPASGSVDDLLALQPRVEAEPMFLPEVEGLPPDEEGRTVIEEIVARVNGRVLTRTMLLDRLLTFQDQLVREAPPDLERRLRGLLTETIETTVDRWLLLEEARHRQADVDAFWRNWLEQKRRDVGATTLEELEALLGEQGLTMEQLKELVIEQEVPNLYVQRIVTERIDTGPEVLRVHYEAHSEAFRVPARVTLRQILLPVGAGEDDSRARAAAEQVIAALAGGADWCDQHAIYGAGTAPCGEVGSLPVTDLLPELQDAVLGLPLDSVSRPLRSSLGVHVITVTGREAGELPPFEAVQERVRRKVIDEAFDAGLDELLVTLRASAQIEINPRYERKAGETPSGGAVSQ